MADSGVNYSAYPYPYPMEVLPALLYALGREFQAVYGRVHTVTTQDWMLNADEVQADLYVQSVLGFPYAGGVLKCAGYSIPYGSGSMLEDTFVLYTSTLTHIPPGTFIPAGSRVTLEVTG